MSEIKFTKIVSALFLVNALEVLPGAANSNLKYYCCYTVLYDCGVSQTELFVCCVNYLLLSIRCLARCCVHGQDLHNHYTSLSRDDWLILKIVLN